MSTLAVRPVDAEWLLAVYKITGTALPEQNGTSPSGNEELKKNLEKKFTELDKRFKSIKGLLPSALRSKMTAVEKDLKAGYKLEALESRLEEIGSTLDGIEKNGFTPDSGEWTDEVRKQVTEFEKLCQKTESELVTRAQKRAQELAKTETNPIVKKRLIAAGSEAKVNFISVPIKGVRERFGPDLTLGGEKKKNEINANYRKELQQTRAEIEKVIDHDRFVKVVRREQKPKELERDVELRKEAIAAARKKLAVLRELDVDRAKEFDTQLKSATKTKTVEQIDTAISLALRHLRVPTKDIANKQNALKGKSATVRKEWKDAKGDRKAKMLELKRTTQGTEALVGTGNAKVIEAGEKLAEDTLKASTDPNVKKFYATVEELKKELEEKDLKAYFSNQATNLLESVKKLGQDADPLDLDDSQQALGPLSEKVKALKDQTTARNKWKDTTKERLNKLRARIMNILDEGMGVTVSKENKARGMMQKFKEISAAYIKPDAVTREVDAEIRKLQRLTDDMYNMKWGNPPNKAGLQKALNTDKLAGDKIKAERKQLSLELKTLEGRRNTADKLRKAQKKRVNGDDALMDEINLSDELLKSAKQLIKSRQLTEATEKVEKAEEKLNEVKGRGPGGDDNHVRYLRTQAAKGWDNAINPIVKVIGAIKDEAVTAAGDDGGKVTAVIEGLTKALFSPAVFSSNLQGPINQLCDAPDTNKKKAAREKVIGELRYLRGQLESNEVLMQLRVNPFKKRMSTVPVKQFFDRIELECTQAIRETK